VSTSGSNNQTIGRVSVERPGKTGKCDHNVNIEWYDFDHCGASRISYPDVERAIQHKAALCVQHLFPKGSPPPSAEQPSTPTDPMRFFPASGADRPRATTKAIRAYPTGLSPRRLELPLLYHRFLWIRLQFSRPAEDLPGSGNSLAGCWRGRKPGHDLTASLDIHRFSTDLDTSNDLKATRAKVCH
jgi:hypothetical protein